jgi:MHS family citrate/tricarballylate:H+ symporter-like MFS transporter
MAEKFSQQAVLEPGAPALTGRATLGATIGNMLEFYDFVTYSFFAIQIGRTFFPSHSQFASLMLSLATFGAGFVTRPIGALVIGAYSDRVGRRPAMILSFRHHRVGGDPLLRRDWYRRSDPRHRRAPGAGLLPGGEVGPTTAYLMEAAAVGRRGLAVSCQPASQLIAATAGALVGMVLSEVMTSEALDSYGWRIAFLIGAIALPFGLWMRTPMDARPARSRRRPPATVLAQYAPTCAP